MLILKDFFVALKDETYCVIKPDEKLPAYSKGSDIDIFCYDLDSTVKKILYVADDYVEQGFEIEILNEKGHTYIDFKEVNDNKIEFRFDLYSSLPYYQNILIKPALFECIIENRKSINIAENCTIYVPCDVDDNILRYIEYQEWYGKRPDKIKHIDFILENNSKSELAQFLRKLHHYTELPKVQAVYPSVSFQEKKVKTRRGESLKSIISKMMPEKIKLLIKRFI